MESLGPFQAALWRYITKTHDKTIKKANETPTFKIFSPEFSSKKSVSCDCSQMVGDGNRLRFYVVRKILISHEHLFQQRTSD